MKILDIIADDSLNEGGFLSKFGIGGIDKYLEKKAAERALAAIEKKYANDIVRQKAAKDIAERYAKLLADAEAAGTPRIKGGLTDLEDLLKDAAKNPNHPTLSNNRYYEDTAFMQMVDDLAEARKTQMVRDIQNPPAPPKEKKPKDSDKEAGKAKDEPKASPAAGAVNTTKEIIKENEEVRKRVSERIKWITTTYRFMLGGQFALILAEWGQEESTIEAQSRLGKIPESDAPYFPPVTTPGVAVSSNAQYATQWKWGALKTDIPYSYDNETARVQCWEDWRKGMNSQTLWQKISAFTGSIIISGKLISVAGKTKWMTDFAKWLDEMDKNTGVIKKTLGMAALGATALLNKGGQLIFVHKMSSDDMNEAFKTVMMGNLLETVPEAAKKAIGVAFDSTILHQGAFLMIATLIKNILGVTGNVIPPRTKEAEPKSNVDAANPMQKDPSQTGNPPGSPVDKTDSSNTQKPAEQPPEDPAKAPASAPIDNTPVGRGKAFSAAKNAGQPSVVINGVTYKTDDFKSDGKYWTNDDGVSFLKY